MKTKSMFPLLILAVLFSVPAHSETITINPITWYSIDNSSERRVTLQPNPQQLVETAGGGTNRLYWEYDLSALSGIGSINGAWVVFLAANLQGESPNSDAYIKIGTYQANNIVNGDDWYNIENEPASPLDWQIWTALAYTQSYAERAESILPGIEMALDESYSLWGIGIWSSRATGSFGTGTFSPVAVLEIDYTPAPAPVPEPTTMLLLASGLVGLAGVRRLRKK